MVAYAENELLKINSFKAHLDKLLCITSCCTLISNLMLDASKSKEQMSSFPSSYMLQSKANPLHLLSNRKFIRLFRRMARIVSEGAYYLANLVSAKTFIMEFLRKLC